LDIRKVLLVGKLALVVVLMIVVVKTAVVLRRSATPVAPASASGAESRTAVGTASRTDTSAANYSAIIEQDVFRGGRSLLTGRSLWQGSTAVLPSAEDELGLLLVGTVSGSPVASRAIIKDIQGKVQEQYRVGDTIAGARVKRIEKDAVILVHNGQSKVLRLHVGRNHSEKTARSQVGSAIAQSAESATTMNHVVPDRPGHVETILSQAVIEPYSVDGRPEGLRISGLENIPVAKDIGLRNGDIIRQVNGQPLTDKRKAFQVLKKARTQPALSVELQREGKTKELSFNLR